MFIFIKMLADLFDLDISVWNIGNDINILIQKINHLKDENALLKEQISVLESIKNNIPTE